MNKKDLKESLHEIRNEMVDEDQAKVESSPQLNKKTEEKIIDNSKPKNKILGALFSKKFLKYAALFAIIIATISILPRSSSNIQTVTSPADSLNGVNDSKGAGSEKKDEMAFEEANEGAGPDYKEGAKPSEEAIADKGVESSEIYPTLPNDSKEKIIYRFSYNLQTLDYKKSEEKLIKLINETNSYVENAQIRDSGNSLKTATYMVRVPKEKSSEFQSKISSIATLTSKSISSENMTKQYKDMEASKKTLDLKEERLQALLKKANKFEDLIMVESELAEIAAEKERLTKGMEDIDHDVKYQYFNLELREVKKTDPEIGKKDGFIQKIGKQFLYAIDDFVNILSSLSLLLVRNWILIIVLAIIAMIVWRLSKKYRY